MRHIYLLRHAHAMPGSPGMADHDRPLSSRGHAECHALHQWIKDNPLILNHIFCSTATRTRETLTRIEEGQADWPLPEYVARLYLASPGELLAQLQVLPSEVTGILIVGHNPGLQELALLLAASPSGRAYEMLELGLSTSALVALTWEGSWSELAPHSSHLMFYYHEAEAARG